MSRFIDRYRFKGDLESVYGAFAEILTKLGMDTSESTETKLKGGVPLRLLRTQEAENSGDAQDSNAENVSDEPGQVSAEIDLTMLSETRTQARVAIGITGARQSDMTPRCVSIAGRITDHITENYPLEVPQARATELPPPTKSRLNVFTMIMTLVVFALAGTGMYFVYQFMTPDRVYVEETTSSSKKQRMKNKDGAGGRGAPKEDAEGEGTAPADKPQILMALTPRPATSSDCVMELELGKPSSLPLLYMTADIEFLSAASSVMFVQTIKLNLRDDSLRSKYKYNLKIPQIPCKNISRAVVSDVPECEIRDQSVGFCRTLVKADPRSAFPIRRF
ncbi:MAG: hypothetical protein ACPGVX_01285 [Thalassobaculaceae bacterium]